MSTLPPLPPPSRDARGFHPVLGGILEGIGSYLTAEREKNFYLSQQQAQREQRIFELLLQSPNEEMQAIGLTGLRQLYSGRKTGFLDRLLGRSGENPAYREALDIVAGARGAGGRRAPGTFGPPPAAAPAVPPAVAPVGVPSPAGPAALPATSPAQGGPIDLQPTGPASYGAPAEGPIGDYARGLGMIEGPSPSTAFAPLAPPQVPAGLPPTLPMPTGQQPSAIPLGAGGGPPPSAPVGPGQAGLDPAAEMVGRYMESARRAFENLYGPRAATLAGRDSLWGRRGDPTPATAAWDESFDKFFDRYMQSVVRIQTDDPAKPKTTKQLMDERMAEVGLLWLKDPDHPDLQTAEGRRWVEQFKYANKLAVPPAERERRNEVEEFARAMAADRRAAKETDAAKKNEAEREAATSFARTVWTTQDWNNAPQRYRGRVQEIMDANGWVVYPKQLQADRQLMERADVELQGLIEDVEAYQKTDFVTNPVAKTLAGYKFNARIDAISRMVGRQKGDRGNFATRDAEDFQQYMRSLPTVFGNAAAYLMPEKVAQSLQEIRARAQLAQATVELKFKARASGARGLLSEISAPVKGDRAVVDRGEHVGAVATWDGEYWVIPDKE